jgi:hypothetical protein
MDARPFRRGSLRRVGATLSCALVLAAAVSALHSARVRELGLADMVARAERIFVGECIGRTVQEDPDGGGAFTEYAFRVIRPLKGVEDSTITFSVAATPDGRGFSGLPVFEPGERTLLLLYPAGPGGKTSPLGLDQGRFHLVRAADGSMRAVNGRGNLRLFKDVSPQELERGGLDEPARGPVRLDDLEQLIRSLAGRGPS